MTIYITGDKHGEIEMYRLYRKKRPYHPQEGDKLIITGDFGLVWDRKPTGKPLHFINFLDRAKWETLFVDGNHENFELLAELPEETHWGGKVGRVSEKIFHLKRGNIYEIDGFKFLAFGGAQSHDKLTRRLGIDWWREEIPSCAEMEYCLHNIAQHDNKVDFVVTHTCPLEISNFFSLKFGMSRDDDPTSKMLSHIASTITFKDWYFGHWHMNIDFGKYHCLWHSFKQLSNS